MGKKRPERESVERLILDEENRKAHDIASEVGLLDIMGYDKAVDYVRGVKKSMKKSGALPFREPKTAKRASNEQRLHDITTLFEVRKGRMSKKAASSMLLLNCYFRLRSDDDNIHIGAIDDTYAKNRELEKPLPLAETIRICELALARYMESIDAVKDAEAKAKGFPGAGLNYSDESIIIKCEVTDDELKLLNSIRKEE